MRCCGLVKLACIDTDRLKLSPKVFHYAQRMAAGDCFPPVKLQRMWDARFKLKDGHHRISAAKLLGRTEIAAKWGIPL